MSVAVNSCQLFGGSSYVTGWLGMIYLVMGVSIFIIVVVYIVSKLLTSSLNAKLTAVVKSEIMQVFLVAIIILILMSFLETSCSLTTGVSKSLTGMDLTPFQFSSYYLGNLAFGRGIDILEQVYTYAITYAIDSRIWGIIGTLTSLTSPDIPLGSLIKVSFPIGGDLGGMYSIISDGYIAILAPILVISIGMLQLQWLALPVIEYTAFTVILPVALVLRIFSFSGGGLRRASNDFLALAIAMYLIYPLMISFDAYAISFIFSPANPVYSCTNCLNTPFTVNTTSSAGFFSSIYNSTSTASSTGFSVTSPSINTLLSTTILSSYASSLFPPEAIVEFNSIISEMGQYIFTALFMFGIDIVVTVAFAMGLSRGLNSGIEGAASFWSGI